MLTAGSFITFKTLFYVMIFLGAVIILLNIIITIFLKNKIPGGFTGKWLTTMWLCMFFFFTSEAAGAFFFMTSRGNIYVAYFFISFGVFSAAVFMAAANRFVYNLIKELETHI